MARAEWHPEARRRYTRVAIALHWIIAALILYNLVSGLLRPVLPRGFFGLHVSTGITILVLSVVRVVWRLTHKPPPFLPMRASEAKLAHVVHLLLYVAMLILPFSGWAMVSANPPVGSPGAAYAEAQRAARVPAVPQRLPTGERVRTPGGPAGQGQGGGQAPRRRGPIMLYGLVPLPMIPQVNELGRYPEGVAAQHEVHERIETFHLWGGWILVALLLLHIGGALKHKFADREAELARMGLGRGRTLPAE